MYPRLFEHPNGDIKVKMGNLYTDMLEDAEVSKVEILKYFKRKYPEEFI